MTQYNLIVLLGPTAVGKTALSIQMAQHLGTEIVSADARQIYKLLTIGTAKPTKAEQQTVQHHLIDYVPIDQRYSAAQFQKDAEKVLEKVWEKSPFAIVTGGSGFYIEALCKGTIELPLIPPFVRERLTCLYKKKRLGPATRPFKGEGSTLL